MSHITYFLPMFVVVSTILISYGTYLDISSNIGDQFQLLGVAIGFLNSIFGIAFVVLEVKEKLLMFTIGIIGALLSIVYLYFWSPLIWDMSISFVYLILNIYSIIYWKSHENPTTHKVPTNTLSFKQCMQLFLLSIVGIMILSWIGISYGRYSSTTQAITDAVTTIFSIIGQLLLAKKYIETWHVWIFVNAISIPLYISIGSFTLAILYFCYFVISLRGLWEWKQNIQACDNIK